MNYYYGQNAAQCDTNVQCSCLSKGNKDDNYVAIIIIRLPGIPVGEARKLNCNHHEKFKEAIKNGAAEELIECLGNKKIIPLGNRNFKSDLIFDPIAMKINPIYISHSKIFSNWNAKTLTKFKARAMQMYHAITDTDGTDN